ncbi:MAG: DUF4838 domain-containing protein [Lentisphaeria bacterium]|nr:DUF4838 domain-containing protein [Lentisphaeria bacterium]
MIISREALKEFVILLPPGAGVTERFAAEELAKYVNRMTCVLLPLRDAAEGGGANRAFCFEIHPDESVRFDGFRISVKGEKVIFSATMPKGILNGVYAFLEENGCCWVWMGEANEVVPQREFLQVDEEVVSPALEFRGECIFSVCRENVEEVRTILDFLGKNRFNLLMTSVKRTEKRPGGWKVNWIDVEKELLPELEKRGIFLNISEHSGRWFFPVSLFEKHPDWFAMNKEGKRFSTGQICYGNEEAVEYLKNAYVAYAKSHPEVGILGTWPEDGYGFCQCEKCREGGVVLKAVNRIARALYEVRPDLLVEYLSYTRETSDVPPDILPEKNVITLVANTNVAKEWKRKSDLAGAKGVYRLHYHITDNTAERANLPLRTELTRKDCKEAVELGLRGIVPFYIGTDTWFRSNFNTFFLGKFCWDPEQDADELLKKLCVSCFPEFPEEAFSLFKALVELPRVDQFVPPPWKLWQEWPTLEKDYDGPEYEKVLSRMKGARDLLAKANEKCQKGSNAAERLVSAEKFIEFQEDMFASWHCRALAVKAFRKKDAPTVRKHIAEAARLEQKMKEAVQGKEEKKYGVCGAWIDYEFFIYWRVQLDKQLYEMRTEENKLPFIDMNPEVELFLPAMLNN